MRNCKANTTAKHPCIGCVYFNVCGESKRTAPCAGRMTKAEKKKEEKRNA